jgi:hypothetical protein
VEKEIFGIGHSVKLPGEAFVSYTNLLQVIAGNVLAVRSSWQLPVGLGFRGEGYVVTSCSNSYNLWECFSAD